MPGATLLLPPSSLPSSAQVAPLTLFWWLYVVSGVTALRYLNVPMFSVIRRSTTLLVVLGEFWVFNKRPTRAAAVRRGLGTGGPPPLLGAALGRPARLLASRSRPRAPCCCSSR